MEINHPTDTPKEPIFECKHDECIDTIHILKNEDANIKKWAHIGDELTVILNKEYIPHSITQKEIRQNNWKLVFMDFRYTPILLFRKV